MHGHPPVAGCQGQRSGLQQPPLMRHQPPNPGVTCAPAHLWSLMGTRMLLGTLHHTLEGIAVMAQTMDKSM